MYLKFNKYHITCTDKFLWDCILLNKVKECSNVGENSRVVLAVGDIAIANDSTESVIALHWTTAVSTARCFLWLRKVGGLGKLYTL